MSPTVLPNNNNNNNNRMMTRDEIMKLARNEYARQLSKYTKAQLLKNNLQVKKTSESNTKLSLSRGQQANLTQQ